MIRSGVCLIALVASAAALAAPSRAEEVLDPIAVSLEADSLADASFVEMLAREQRLIAISSRVRRGGVELCGDDVAPVLGLQVTRVRDLPAVYVNAGIRRLGSTDGVRVTWILAGSAAERAGLAPGDVIRSVDGEPIEAERDLYERRAAPGVTSLRFAIERSGEPREIDVPYEPGCSVQPELVVSSQNNALKLKSRVVVFSELMRDARSDDEIAAVVGHELGHKVLGHTGSTPDAEADADYFGLYLCARSGYDPGAGAEYWRRRARTAPWSLLEGGTHPSAPKRVLAAQRAIQEIAAKRAAGRPLVPEGAE